MRTLVIALFGIGFSAALDGSASAQGLDAPIATAPSELAADDPALAQAGPGAPSATIDLTRPRETVTAEALSATDIPDRPALAGSTEVERPARAQKMVPLSPTSSFGSHTVGAGEAGGGFLRTNPALQRANRKQVGFAFRF